MFKKNIQITVYTMEKLTPFFLEFMKNFHNLGLIF